MIKTITLMMGCASAMPCFADVQLQSNDGTVTISGELLSFENGLYIVRTDVGDLRIGADKVSCEGEDCPEPTLSTNNSVSIAASGLATSSLVPAIIQQYAAVNGATALLSANPEDENWAGFVVASSGEIVGNVEAKQLAASAAFNALLAGDVDLVLTERRATNIEVDRFLAAGLGDLTDPQFETIIGQDAASIIVSPQNPVQSITLAQSEAIFAGQITNWNELGGADRPIKLYAPKDGSALSEFFTAAVLDANFSSFSQDADRTLELGQIEQRVSQDPSAIGIVSSANIQAAQPMTLSLVCGIQASPNGFAVRSEAYPMTRRIYAYTTSRSQRTGAPTIVNLLQSKTGRQIVSDGGFLDLSADIAGLDAFGQQMAYSLSSPAQAVELPNLRAFASEVLDAKRLSTTFRFSTGSSQIDNKARADVGRLTELLQLPEYQGSEILLVGFTDSIGKSVVNTVLSQRRAEQVRTAIVEESNGLIDASAITTLGFGASMPTACNENNFGREINRRVEVWIR